MTPSRFSRVLRRLTAANVAALVVFLLAEIVLFFVVIPSPELLELLFPVCHDGILGSLFLALVLVVLHSDNLAAQWQLGLRGAAPARAN